MSDIIPIFLNDKPPKLVSGSDSTSYAVMEDDGNFVLYNGYGNAVWATNTGGNPGSRINIPVADIYIEDSNNQRIATFITNAKCP
jgi:hypothetical protein